MRHIRQFHVFQLQVSDGAVSDGIATYNDKLNDDLPIVVTPPRSSLEYSAADIAITTGEIGSNQIIPINTAQSDEIIQSSNGRGWYRLFSTSLYRFWAH